MNKKLESILHKLKRSNYFDDETLNEVLKDMQQLMANEEKLSSTSISQNSENILNNISEEDFKTLSNKNNS